MTASEWQIADVLKPKTRTLGVRARLLLAFLGISAFAVFAAAAGIYSFRSVGDRLAIVDTRVQPTLNSLELSRSAERIIAAAPALLAASDRNRRDAVKAELETEVDHLKDRLAELKRNRMEALPLLRIEPIVSSLMANLSALEVLVARRLDINDRIGAFRRSIFQVNDETQRLFAPWLMVTDSQTSTLLTNLGKMDPDAETNTAAQLGTQIRLQRSLQIAQQQFSGAVDLLTEASTAEQLRRLPVLAFQLTSALRDLETSARDLDPKLRPLFQEQVGKLRDFVTGPNSVTDARGQELALIDDGQQRLRENANLSGQLTAAVDQLADTAKREVSTAIVDALSVQRLGTQLLISLVALSLLTSALIVWLYVSRNIARRLTALSDGMREIAGGKLSAEVTTEGTDEIAAMGRAVEIFRKNTLERDDLLAEKAEAAERLEKQVKERTAELARSVQELRALGEVSQAVNLTLDLDTVLSTIVAKATQLSNTEAGAIYVFDSGSQEFRLRATFGMDDTIITKIKDRRIKLGGETAISRASRQRKPIQIPDVQNDSSLVLDIIVRAGFRALLIVPLLGAKEIVGALVVRRKQPGEFPDSTVELLETFASQSVLAIQNARLFREIANKSEQLEIASKHKSQFLANMSHELRTPLNAILGYTELVLDGIYGDLPGKMRGVLERVQSNGRHLLGLINDVLDLSKIEAGQLTLSIADYSLPDIVQSVLSAVESLASEKQLALKMELPPVLPKGRGDERRIAQVLLNLTGNAIKFTDEGEVTIEASVANGSFILAVRDTGPGIAAKDQVKIFEEFQQADNSPTRRKGGSGLGLSISKRIIEMHGGQIWVESEFGQGSTFKFMLPVIVEQQGGKS